MKKIIVTVTKKGQVKVQTEGFTGSSCMEASKRIEELLGNAKTVEHTSEYYEQEVCTGEDVCQKQ